MNGNKFTKKLRLAVALMVIALLFCMAAQSRVLSAQAQNGRQSVQRYVIELPDGAMLTDAQGQPLTEKGSIRTMYPIENLSNGEVRFAAEGMESGGYALLDENGQPLTEYKYRMLEEIDGGIMFMIGERTGIMDSSGAIRIDAQYTYMTACGDGSFLALRTSAYDDSADMVYRVSADGSELSTGTKVVMLGEFDEAGLCAAMSADGFKYGYLNAQGAWAIEPRFDWAGEFVNGQAQAGSAEGMGLISTRGEWLIEPKYDLLTREGDSLIAAVSGETVHLIDPENLSIVASLSGASALGICGGRAGIMQDDTLTVIDRSGKELFSIGNCSGFNLWNGMRDEVIVSLLERTNNNTYLFGMDGTRLAGPYQDIMPLGMGSEGMNYLAITYQATQVEYGNGMSFWDEIHGTRRCRVLASDGSVLCEAEAGYISLCGTDRILIHGENVYTFADLNGNACAQFEIAVDARENPIEGLEEVPSGE
jgi:hypothetical protein